VKAIMRHLEQQDEAMIDILRKLEDQHEVLMARFMALHGELGEKPSPV